MARLVIAAISGAVGGATIGFLAGGFLGARRRVNLDLADERGVVVGVRDGQPAALRALLESRPLRVDRVRGAQPVATVFSHEYRTPDETVGDQPISPRRALISRGRQQAPMGSPLGFCPDGATGRRQRPQVGHSSVRAENVPGPALTRNVPGGCECAGSRTKLPYLP